MPEILHPDLQSDSEYSDDKAPSIGSPAPVLVHADLPSEIPDTPLSDSDDEAPSIESRRFTPSEITSGIIQPNSSRVNVLAAVFAVAVFAIMLNFIFPDLYKRA